MHAPDSKNKNKMPEASPPRFAPRGQGSKKTDKESGIEVEWYSGKDLPTHPKRVKVGGCWEEVFKYEKQIHEDAHTKHRQIIFLCHIGDKRIIKVAMDT